MKMLRLVSVGQKGWIRSFFLWLLWHGVACRRQSTPKRLRCGHVPEMQGLLEWWPLQNLCATGSGLWCYAGANVIDHQQWVETGTLEENYSIVEREKRTTTHIYNLYIPPPPPPEHREEILKNILVFWHIQWKSIVTKLFGWQTFHFFGQLFL